MRRVAYCSGGTVVAFPIPDQRYDSYITSAGDDGSEDLHASCAVLERVVSLLKTGGIPCSGSAEIDAACRIWHFFNPIGKSNDDIVIVDHVGDGLSLEFAPMADMSCSLASASCACRHGARMAEPAFA